MAAKEYAYFVKGHKIALVEKDTAFDNDANSRDFGPGSNRAQWKSPLSTVADGIEIEYTYAPTYFIKETDDKNTVIDTYVSTDGFLKIIDQGDDNYSASPESLSDGSYIVLRKAGKFNGLHKVKEAGVGYITLYTKYSGSATVQKAFEETVELYYNIDVLNDSDDEIPLPPYLERAMVMYVQARISEDRGEMDKYEYLMARFHKMVEKHESSKVWGARMLSSGYHAIR